MDVQTRQWLHVSATMCVLRRVAETQTSLCVSTLCHLLTRWHRVATHGAVGALNLPSGKEEEEEEEETTPVLRGGVRARLPKNIQNLTLSSSALDLAEKGSYGVIS